MRRPSGSTAWLAVLGVSAALWLAACSEDEARGAPPLPPKPVYSGSPITLTQFKAAAGVVPEDREGADGWFIFPQLPRGLEINRVTGEIIGTPTALLPATEFEVTATNAYGQTSGTLRLAVQAPETGVDDDLPCYGVNYVSYYNDPVQAFDGTASRALIERLVPETGANCVAVVWNWYVDDLEDTEVRAITIDAPDDPNHGPTATNAQLADVIARFRAQGLRVWLKPHVDVRDGSFRGDIHFDDAAEYDDWMTHYEVLLFAAADFAENQGADGLVVGTELDALADARAGRQTARWRSLIAEIRARFNGTLTYASNWPSTADIVFWDDLDLMGVDGYFPLTGAGVSEPTTDELAQAWLYFKGTTIQRPFSHLGALVEQYGKPLLMTEIGYRSRKNCAFDPPDFSDIADDDPDNDAALSDTCQASAYQAVYDVFADQPWFAGALFWNWEVFPGAEQGELPDDSDPDQHYLTRGFTSYRKPASVVLLQANTALLSATAESDTR